MCKAAKAKLAELEDAIAGEEAEVQRLTAEAAGLTARAEALAEALAGVGGPKLRKARDAVQRLQEVRGLLPCCCCCPCAFPPHAGCDFGRCSCRYTCVAQTIRSMIALHAAAPSLPRARRSDS